MLAEHHFRAMNTDVGVWLWSTSPVASALLHEVEEMFCEVEARLSRFRDDSELSRLNAQAGRGEVTISPLLQRVLSRALIAAHSTGGIFDPTVLPFLRQAGYDRSFELVAQSGERRGVRDAVGHQHAWRQVKVSAANGTAALPDGVGIDLGGIAKGWAVDRAWEFLRGWGPVLVDAGGDLRGGGLPQGSAWPVGVQDPFHPEQNLLILELNECAVATSTIGKRNWQYNGERFHHLIDPRTGRSADSDLHTVTVVASFTEQAEVAAKTALVLGSRQGADWLRRQGHPALFIHRSGDRTQIGQLPIQKRDEQ